MLTSNGDVVEHGMITTNGDVIDRKPQRGDLYVSIRPGYTAPLIRRLTRYGKKIISLRDPFFLYNKYGENRRRSSFDLLIQRGFWKLRVPQPGDEVTGSLGGRCTITQATERIATAMDQSDETHWFPIADLRLTRLYRDNRAYWQWGGEARHDD